MPSWADEIENYKEKRAAEYRKLANRIRDAKNSKTVIGGMNLGNSTDEFMDLASQMWFSREFEVEAESDVKPRPGTREQSDSTSLVPAAVPLPRNPTVTDKTLEIVSVSADAVKREIPEVCPFFYSPRSRNWYSFHDMKSNVHFTCGNAPHPLFIGAR